MSRRIHPGAWMYRDTRLYALVMKSIYGPGYAHRYRDVAELVPEGAHVVEIAPGDGRLYQRHLRHKVGSYLGLELSPAFLRKAEQNGIPYRPCDIRHDEIPQADVVVMQAALYQFIPQHEKILDKMIRAARQRVIVAEPVRNPVARHVRPFERLTAWLTLPPEPAGYDGRRFDDHDMEALFRSFPEFESMKKAAAGRERIGIFKGRAPQSSAS